MSVGIGGRGTGGMGDWVAATAEALAVVVEVFSRWGLAGWARWRRRGVG